MGAGGDAVPGEHVGAAAGRAQAAVGDVEVHHQLRARPQLGLGGGGVEVAGGEVRGRAVQRHGVEHVDAERLAIGAAFGLELISLKDTYPAMGYGPRGDTFWSVIRGVAALNGIKGPMQIDSRYLTEDVPIGLTIYAQLGRQIGLEPVLMESVIHLTRALLGTDFGDVPRTLARCGLDGLDRDGIQFYVTTGRRPG